MAPSDSSPAAPGAPAACVKEEMPEVASELGVSAMAFDAAATPASRKKAMKESKKQFDAAIEGYTQAIDLGAPEQDEVLGCRAECYAACGQLDKALEDATAAADLNDESDSWLMLKGLSQGALPRKAVPLPRQFCPKSVLDEIRTEEAAQD